MPIFKKSTKLNNVGYDIRGPVLDEAERMAEAGITVLKLNTGNPAPFGFAAPDSVVSAMAESLKNTQGYSESKGIIEARQAIVNYCKFKNIPGVTEKDVFTGNGVSEMITIAMQALLDSGDEILIPMPDYPLWTAAATLAGGNAVHYICDESNEWLPDLDDIRKKISPRTKAIVVINPNNPTGAVYPETLLAEIAEIARQNGLIVFADEIYDRIIYDGHKHTAMASLAPDLFCVTMNGISKSHMVAGFRCGWMCVSGDKRIAKDYIDGLNMLTSMRLCSNVPSQAIIKTALESYNNADSFIRPGGRLYEQREYIYNAINGIPGLSVVKPKAAFYLFPKIDAAKFNISDDEQFVLDFLHERHVLLTQGGGFNWPRPDHFRIVYLPEMSQLEYLAENMRGFLETYRQ
ncbi:MAG: pyridoxal phosphate-dependent aminotransferase [Oscillospiraceae bacterium]|jgi:alanine-synthesizing transaminase|nr:pyridoxal phosphate-dependent aminotransferase [Oscillospiraceae bacterium]